MKREISPGVMIAVLAVIVLIVGVLAFRTFFTNPNSSPLEDPAKMKEFQDAKKQSYENWQKTVGSGGGGAYRNGTASRTATPGTN